MIVDSSALPEQVVMMSFNPHLIAQDNVVPHYGVILQEEIAPKLLDMLKGAMAELTIGDPSFTCDRYWPCD